MEAVSVLPVGFLRWARRVHSLFSLWHRGLYKLTLAIFLLDLCCSRGTICLVGQFPLKKVSQFAFD